MKNNIVIFGKIFALINVLFLVFLTGGGLWTSHGRGILDIQIIFQFYSLFVTILLVLGIIGFILGLIIKINKYEITQDLTGRGLRSIGTLLLFSSPLLIFLAFFIIWITKFSSF